MGRIGLLGGLANRVRNRHDGKTYAISTLKNPVGYVDPDSIFATRRSDFYETVVWEKRWWQLIDPDERRALLVVNSLDESRAETEHNRVVGIVESEPREGWARKYVLVRRLSVRHPVTLNEVLFGRFDQYPGVILRDRLLREE